MPLCFCKACFTQGVWVFFCVASTKEHIKSLIGTTSIHSLLCQGYRNCLQQQWTQNSSKNHTLSCFLFLHVFQFFLIQSCFQMISSSDQGDKATIMLVHKRLPVCRCAGLCALLRVKSVYKEDIKGGLSQLNYLT